MPEVPSLVSLALEAIVRLLVQGDDDALQLSDVFELPSHLFDILLTKLPPLALHKLQMEMPYESSNVYKECFDSDVCFTTGRKRGRSCNFNTEWKKLFKLRWSQMIDNIDTDDWHQKYWETHLQNCLDEAAGSSMVSFKDCIGEINVPDYILKSIGCNEHLNQSAYSELSFHFQQFGCYARCVRLQSVLCDAEICQLLRNSQLQSLALRWIRSDEHVEGLCQLLIQNRETLTSLEFIHCKLSSTFVDAIFRSLELKSKQTYRIENFSVRTSTFLETNVVSFPPSLGSFLSSGRSLTSLRFSGNDLDQKFARILFTLLFDAASSVSILDLSDNIIEGWLSNFNRGSSSRVSSALGISKALQSLRVLNVRNNNLQKYDVESLRHSLLCMPNLEILDLGENPIEDEGIRCLVPYFAEAKGRCSPLLELNLESCDLSCKGVILLLDTLSTLEEPLYSLSLADNVLGSPIAGTLGKFLATSIRVLNVGGIGLGFTGFKELKNGIMGQSKLVEINISKNRGGLEAAEFLLNLMSLAPDLVGINASYNLMPAESLNLICSALRTAKCCLQRLDLTGNTWDLQQTHASILAEFQHNGRPILILPSLHAPDVRYDDDP